MDINDGLILPFRFYDTIEKQMRYRGCGRYENGDEIRHNEYLISFGCRLLPFQVRRATDPNKDLRLLITNVMTGGVTNVYPFTNAADWIVETVGDYDYITYLANNDILNGVNCAFDNCIYYATLYVNVTAWYSELFKVVDVNEIPDPDYRIWSPARGCFRIWEDDDDLRITKE